MTPQQPIMKRTRLFEVPLGTIALQKQINFQFNSELAGIQLYSLQAYSASDIVSSPTLLPVISDAGLASIVITLFIDEDEQVYQYPLSDLRPQNAGGLQRLLDNKRINISKSYITILSLSNLANNTSLMLNFVYEKK
jgi:hypothetical protein